MTLPRKPPLVADWDIANREKRTDACRVCGRTDRKIELAHTCGIEHDTRDAVVEVRDGKKVRVQRINPDRVIPLCGPSTDPASCHGKQHASRLDIRGFLTDREWEQAKADEGLGQAMRCCAPLTRDLRTDWNSEGELIEVEITTERKAA